MCTHNICFCGGIRKIFTGYPPLSRPMISLLMSTHICFYGKIRKNIMWMTPFTWSYEALFLYVMACM